MSDTYRDFAVNELDSLALARLLSDLRALAECYHCFFFRETGALDQAAEAWRKSRKSWWW
jgi:hypothetical protein